MYFLVDVALVGTLRPQVVVLPAWKADIIEKGSQEPQSKSTFKFAPDSCCLLTCLYRGNGGVLLNAVTKSPADRGTPKNKEGHT